MVWQREIGTATRLPLRPPSRMVNSSRTRPIRKASIPHSKKARLPMPVPIGFIGLRMRPRNPPSGADNTGRSAAFPWWRSPATGRSTWLVNPAGGGDSRAGGKGVGTSGSGRHWFKDIVNRGRGDRLTVGCGALSSPTWPQASVAVLAIFPLVKQSASRISSTYPSI